MRDNGLLSDCLVDSDLDAAQRARVRRRKALAISLAVEFVLLAGLLAWPLMNPSTMSARYAIDPVPPYGAHSAAHAAGSSKPQTGTTTTSILSHQPTSIPTHTSLQLDTSSGQDSPPDISMRSGDCDACVPGRPGIPGGSETGPPISRPPEPKPPAATKPLIVSGGAQEALLIRRVEPAYPTIARQIRLSGTVELRAIISKDGAVIDLQVASGNPILARAAVEAVRQWRYRPTLLNSQPVEVQTFVTVKFVLQ